MWGNFLKSNYRVNLADLLLLRVGIKIIGSMYIGVLSSEAVTLLRNWYEKHLARKGKLSGIVNQRMQKVK